MIVISEIFRKYKILIFSVLSSVFIISCGIFYTLYYSPRKEAETLEKCYRVEDSGQRVESFQRFLEKYPKSKNRVSINNKIIQLMLSEINDTVGMYEFFSLTLLAEDDLISKQSIFDFTKQIFMETGLNFPSGNYSIKNKTGILRFLVNLYLCSEILNKYVIIENYCDQLINFSKINPEILYSISNSVISQDDTLAINISNKLLIKAIHLNRVELLNEYNPGIHSGLLSNKRDEIFYKLFLQLAINTYLTENYIYAINLISQAAKYSNMSESDGLIFLGAIRSEIGETERGWDNILEGLLINNKAEKESRIIAEIYKKYYYKIFKNNKADSYLKQYRQSNSIGG